MTTPTAQEWTVDGATVIDSNRNAVFVCDTHNGAKHLANAHNASIAAEREGLEVVRTLHFAEVSALKAQLETAKLEAKQFDAAVEAMRAAKVDFMSGHFADAERTLDAALKAAKSPTKQVAKIREGK